MSTTVDISNAYGSESLGFCWLGVDFFLEADVYK